MIQNKKPPSVSAKNSGNVGTNVSPFATKSKTVLPSPFAVAHRAPIEEELGDDEAYYRLNEGGPTLVAADVESATTRAVEVQVLWGEYDAIHLSLLSPARSFVVGEDGADFAMERAQIGAARYPLTVVEDGATFVIVPSDAEITVRNRGVERRLSALHAEGALAVTSELPGALRYRLADEDVVRVRRAGFVFQVKSVAAPKRVAAARKVDATPAFYVGGAATFVGMLMLALSLANPAGATLSNDGIDTSNRLVQSIIAPVERTDPERASTSDSASSEDGARASGDEGQAGRPDRPVNGNRGGRNGQVTPTNPATPSDAVSNNRVLSTIATLSGSLLGGTSPFSASSAVGSDPMATQGALLGVQIGEGGGFGGLGLNSRGLGGGNPEEGIRAGGIATNGYGPGRGPGGPGRFGRCQGVNCGDDLGPREGVVPSAIPAPGATVNGTIPADVIRRVIQRNIGQVRYCYEQALNGRPDLAGRVTVRFAISPSGAVQTAVATSTFGEARVEGCIASAMRRLTFPAPDGGGMVMVSYPFVLSSAGR